MFQPLASKSCEKGHPLANFVWIRIEKVKKIDKGIQKASELLKPWIILVFTSFQLFGLCFAQGTHLGPTLVML